MFPGADHANGMTPAHSGSPQPRTGPVCSDQAKLAALAASEDGKRKWERGEGLKRARGYHKSMIMRGIIFLFLWKSV